ncbi:ring-h2 finger protein atl3-like [Stylonychia lemnae]|uniref:Ring-h2 finger protein atl3-like n=1 Tax=Stylonychia lemnae TaxID=5949 RepID=A0A078AXT7_STYLE|nr:ring-h2 finger protein atl3-like [Stylonychia lemnae]|eukprot:CDW87265.1 ring-h2 finger protein atl3-like [Stylonychia lemnae]
MSDSTSLDSGLPSFMKSAFQKKRPVTELKPNKILKSVLQQHTPQNRGTKNISIKLQGIIGQKHDQARDENKDQEQNTVEGETIKLLQPPDAIVSATQDVNEYIKSNMSIFKEEVLERDRMIRKRVVGISGKNFLKNMRANPNGSLNDSVKILTTTSGGLDSFSFNPDKRIFNTFANEMQLSLFDIDEDEDYQGEDPRVLLRLAQKKKDLVIQELIKMDAANSKLEMLVKDRDKKITQLQYDLKELREKNIRLIEQLKFRNQLPKMKRDIASQVEQDIPGYQSEQSTQCFKEVHDRAVREQQEAIQYLKETYFHKYHLFRRYSQYYFSVQGDTRRTKEDQLFEVSDVYSDDSNLDIETKKDYAKSAETQINTQPHNVNDGRRQNGLTNEEFRKIPAKTFKKQMLNNGTCRYFKCKTCEKDFVEGDKIKMLFECNHEFHRDCLRPLLQESKSCPFCDKEIVAKKLSRVGKKELIKRLQIAQQLPQKESALDDTTLIKAREIILKKHSN